MKSLFATCLFVVLALAMRAEPYTYLTAEAQRGDGMYTLLARYGLPLNSCYQDQFRQLNSLSAKQSLRVGVEYRVPVLVYVYNGRSIRSTLGINDLPLAKEIQAYNREREGSGQQDAAYETSGELWVPYGLLFCERERSAVETEVLVPIAPAEAIAVRSSANEPSKLAEELVEELKEPSTKPKRGYAIFGERYAEVPRVDAALRGKIFYLVSGHGGPDPGAVGSKRDHMLCEDEYAYDVVLRLARNIISHGGVPYVIVRDEDDGIRDDEYLDCDRDEIVWGDAPLPLDQRARLRQRSDVINKLAASAKTRGAAQQYCVVVHVDSRHRDKQTDLFFYHQRDSKVSTELSEQMRAAMERNYRRNGRSREYSGGVHTRDLHMLREVNVPTVYIELGNIQHEFDQQRVLRATNRQALANWFAEGIIAGTRT